MIIKNLRKSTKPKKLLIGIAVLVGLISTFLILEATGITHFINNPVSKTVDQNKEAETNSSNKQDLINGKTDNSNTSNTTTEPTSNDITLSARQETDRSVTILTELRNYSDGTCDLTIKNGDETYTPPTVPVLYQDSFSTCEGFSIPANTLANGTWQISLTVTSKGKVNTNTISAEVQ